MTAATYYTQMEAELERLKAELEDCRNELCLYCGRYQDGPCTACRWSRDK